MAKKENHLSDGTKAVCGKTGKAEQKNDPLVWCRVYHRDLVDGTDFQFTFEQKLYHLISGGVTKIARSVIIHLRGCHYPTPKYQQGETGGAVKIEGQRHRYVINELSEEEVQALQVKPPKRKTG